MIKTCKCGEKIIFLKTAQGKVIPVNFEEWIRPEYMFFDSNKMTAHFATCPKVEEFRRKKVKC